jgi:hypothetical protein
MRDPFGIINIRKKFLLEEYRERIHENGRCMIRNGIMLAALLMLWAASSVAAPIKIHVNECAVTGSSEKEALKTALQTMLSSRLSGEGVTLVGKDENPDLTIACTYIVFGKVFSIDGQIVEKGGKILAKAFEQGESADEVIPAVGRLAVKLNREIEQKNRPLPGTSPSTPAVATRVADAPSSAGIVSPQNSPKSSVQVTEIKDSEIIRPETSPGSGATIQKTLRLEGVFIGVAPVKSHALGKRTIAVVQTEEIRLYDMNDGLTLLSSDKAFGGNEKIVGIDSADLDGDGSDELYVTCFRGEDLASRVYRLENGKLIKIAGELPYFFRAISLAGGAKKIYAQQMSNSEDFFGDLYELVRKGSGYDLAHPMKLPRFSNIYRVNMFKGGDGKTLFVSLHPDGYLLVSAEKGETLWKSSDKFGGSELYFSRDDNQNMKFTGSRFRKVFLEQRIIVTADGTILVPKHEGGYAIGDSRSYGKSSIYAFKWNGALLEEIWHTKQDQSYIADYGYDDDRKEVLLLEVVKREGIFEKGASALLIKRVE